MIGESMCVLNVTRQIDLPLEGEVITYPLGNEETINHFECGSSD